LLDQNIFDFGPGQIVGATGSVVPGFIRTCPLA
jgi:hypothetical protein